MRRFMTRVSLTLLLCLLVPPSAHAEDDFRLSCSVPANANPVEKLMADVRLKNNSSESLKVLAMPEVRFIVARKNQDNKYKLLTANPMTNDGLIESSGPSQTLQRDAEWSFKECVSSRFDLTLPGKYRITATILFNSKEVLSNSQEVTISNPGNIEEISFDRKKRQLEWGEALDGSAADIDFSISTSVKNRLFGQTVKIALCLRNKSVNVLRFNKGLMLSDYVLELSPNKHEILKDQDQYIVCMRKTDFYLQYVSPKKQSDYILGPGESMSLSVPANLLFHMDDPQEYYIKTSLSLGEKQALMKVESNLLTIRLCHSDAEVKEANEKDKEENKLKE